MKWLKFSQDQVERYAWVHDRASFGSARSNEIILEGKGIRPLHGQFHSVDQSLRFRDFLTRQAVLLRQGAEAEVGSWRLQVLGDEQIESEIIKGLQANYKHFIQKHLDQNLSEEELQRRYLQQNLLNSKFLEEARSWIGQLQREISLDSPIEKLLEDEEVTDVLVNSYNRIFIEKNSCLMRSEYRFSSQENYELYIQNLLASENLQFSPKRGRIDFKSRKGFRMHIIGEPFVASGFCLSIRRASPVSWRLRDFQNRNFLSAKQASILRNALQNKENIVVSGATGSGKTSLLKSLLLEISNSDRILILEDTPELNLDKENILALQTHEEVGDLKDLLRESLRMRPDRLVVGEVRGEEAFYLLMALNTGHRGCLSTLHANSSRDALWRLQSLIRLHQQSLSEEAVRDLLARNIDLLVHLERDPETRMRRISGISRIRGSDGRQFVLEELNV